jgi:hypothetical protein
LDIFNCRVIILFRLLIQCLELCKEKLSSSSIYLNIHIHIESLIVGGRFKFNSEKSVLKHQKTHNLFLSPKNKFITQCSLFTLASQHKANTHLQRNIKFLSNLLFLSQPTPTIKIFTFDAISTLPRARRPSFSP